MNRLQFALRQLRNAWRAGEIRVLLFALVLAVAAMTAVGFFADRIEAALGRQGGMLLGGDRTQQQRQLGALLDGYEQFRDFDRRELALIEPLRTLRLIHYSAWLAKRWDDPIFPINFPWFGTPAYWQEQVQWLAQQVEAMDQPPLVA